jgi:acyl carrier protein
MQSPYPPKGAQASPGPESHEAVVSGPTELPAQDEIQDWLVSYLSELLEMAPGDIDINDTLAAYGLDSSGAVGMIGDLGEWLGRKLDPGLLYSYPTIANLARYLVGVGGH